MEKNWNKKPYISTQTLDIKENIGDLETIPHYQLVEVKSIN